MNPFKSLLLPDNFTYLKFEGQEWEIKVRINETRYKLSDIFLKPGLKGRDQNSNLKSVS